MGKTIDMTGWVMKEHGIEDSRLTVLEKTNKRDSSGNIVWKCKCECGNICEILGKSIRNGNTKSCGCYKNETAKKTFLKIIPKGTKFGKLTVLELLPETKEYGKTYYKCQCDCGNIINIQRAHLLNKNCPTRSCGCLQKEMCLEKNSIDIPLGTKFGKLTTIKKLNKQGNYYLCKCDCGNTKEVTAQSLRAGTCLSCGCLKSKGEAKISQILQNNNILFEKQKIFDNCKFLDTNYPAKFDFYVDNQYIIEFDGIQHFKTLGGWNNEEHLKMTQEHDAFKNQWCKKNNIPIIRIPYTHLNKICLEDLELKTSKFLVE